MKKVSLLIMGFAAAFATKAQNTVGYLDKANPGIDATVHKIATTVDNSTSPIAYSQGGTLAAAGDTIQYYDFNTSTGWTAQATGTTRGWFIGSLNPWFTNGINSTSGADWAVLRPGNPTQGALTAADYNLTSSAINCAGRSSVVLSFEQRYFRFEDTSFVQISTDGTNFTTVYDNFWLPITASGSQNPTPNPHKVTINISRLAANQPQVYVRFRWISRQAVQPGIGYGWWIDDVMLSEGESNDIQMDEAYYRPYTDSTYTHYADFYTRIPNKQARKYNMDFGAKFSNLGGATQSNAGFDVFINGPSSFSATASATISNLAPISTDSASTNASLLMTGGVGTYDIDIVAKSDSVLKLKGDDSISTSLMVTDSIYARDDNDITNAGAFFYQPSGVWKWEVGAIYEIKTLDSLRGVQWLNLAANTRRAGKTGTVTAHVYNVGSYTRNSLAGVATAPIFSSQPIKISDLQSRPDEWIHMPVTRNQGAGVGDTIGVGNYLVTIEGDQNFGTDTVFWPVQRTDFTPSQYLLRIEAAGQQYGNWSFGGRKYMVRMVTAPTSCPVLVGTQTTTKSTTSCGASDGEAEVTTDPTNGVGPFSYTWDVNGSIMNTKKVTGLSSGNYSVTISDGNGCKVVTSASVSDFGAPTLAQNTANSVTSTTCFGRREGVIAVDVTPGNNPPPYNYKWFNVKSPATTISTDTILKNIEAGTYTVEVSDNASPPCVQSLTITVNGPTKGVGAAVAPTRVNCKGASTGAIEVVPRDGQGNYNIQWSDGPSTALNRTGLSAGVYNFTVTDGNGCTFTSGQRIDQPGQDFVLNPAGQGTSSINTATKGKATITISGKGGYTSTISSVEWKNPNGAVLVGATTNILTVGAGQPADRDGAGIYVAKATSADGCVATENYEVEATNDLFPLAIKQFGENFKLNVYPNPSNGSFKVFFNNTNTNTYTVSVKNVVGQIVYNNETEISGNHTEEISLNNVDAGVYFLNISNGKVDFTTKLIVE